MAILLDFRTVFGSSVLPRMTRPKALIPPFCGVAYENPRIRTIREVPQRSVGRTSRGVSCGSELISKGISSACRKEFQGVQAVRESLDGFAGSVLPTLLAVADDGIVLYWVKCAGFQTRRKNSVGPESASPRQGWNQETQRHGHRENRHEQPSKMPQTD